MTKKNAYVEHRPLSANAGDKTIHHVVIVDGQEVYKTDTQLEAEEWANKQGYAVHVARERHLQNRDTPAHWRKSDI